MTPARVLARVRRRLPALTGDRSTRPQVLVELDGPTVPAWVLRTACAAVAIGCALPVVRGTGAWAVAGVLIASLVLRPSASAPAALAAGIGLLQIASPAAPFPGRLALLVLGLHLLVDVAALVGDLPASARVEGRVLAAAVGPFLAVQAVAQTVALLAGVVATRPPTSAWLPVVAGAVLAAAAWGIATRLGRTSV